MKSQLVLNCSCGEFVRATTVAPAYLKLSDFVEHFLRIHDGPEHIVTDRDGVVVPPPAVVEVRRAGGQELPGFDEVATKPEERKYPT